MFSTLLYILSMTKQKKVKVKKTNTENQIIKTVDNIVVYF
jgi:hypothetical protein